MTQSTKFLTTRQLAGLWMVSEATIKRWADAGQLGSSRTVGGHRRFPVHEVVRFQTERGLGAVPVAAPKVAPAPEAAGQPDEGELAEGFFRAVTRGHSAEAAATLLDAHLRGLPLPRLLDVSVAATMRRVGELWHDAEMSVAEEHVTTSAAAHALRTLSDATRRAPEHGRLAICCAAEGEMHVLAVLCAQAILESEGWEVLNLGAHTPFFALAELAEQRRPALVCVSSTLRLEIEHNARDFVRMREAARASGARVVLGGEGFREEAVRRRFPADLHAESFEAFEEFLRRAE